MSGGILDCGRTSDSESSNSISDHDHVSYSESSEPSRQQCNKRSRNLNQDQSVIATAWQFRVEKNFISLNNTSPLHSAFGTEMEMDARGSCLSDIPPELLHFTVIYATDPIQGSNTSVLMKLRIYIHSKTSSLATWKSWIAGWNVRFIDGKKMKGGFARNTEYLKDLQNVDAKSPANNVMGWKVLLTHGLHPQIRSRAWCFSGDMKVEINRDHICMHELNSNRGDAWHERHLRLCEEAFSKSFLHDNKLPHAVNYALVYCDLRDVLQLTDDAGSSPSNVTVRLKGFVQTRRMDIRTCQQWLGPPQFAWHPLHGGLHGSKAYETVTAQASNQEQSWHELLSRGVSVSNNAGRMATKEVKSFICRISSVLLES